MATWLLLVLSLLGWKALGAAQDQNPHQPFKVTWKLRNGETYEVLKHMTATHLVNTWWPDLYFHLKELMETSWARAYLRKCPGHKRDQIKTCGGMQSRQCKAWECVTSNDGCWKWSVARPSDLVTMTFVNPITSYMWNKRFTDSCPDCDLVKVSFTSEGQRVIRWTLGLVWGIYGL